MIDVTIQNFETEVIAASMQIPVLVDFWAPWCGPCKVIGPILEKLEAEYGGRFKLAKIDSDQEQQLAQAFGVRSIPTCILVMNGQPVDGFTGAQVESKIREFLDKHVPEGDGLELMPSEAEEAQALLESGDTEAALMKLQEALAVNPANDDARYDYVKLLIASGYLEEAGPALQPALVQIPVQIRFEALSQWLNALHFVALDARRDWAAAEFDTKIAENKRDFETRFAKSRVLMSRGEWTEAMDELLEIIMRDRKWEDEAARKAYVAILELLTPPKPKADATAAGKSAGGIELTGQAAMQQDETTTLLNGYRRKLSMALN